MTGSAALYQVAVALIPALLFGGATLQLREQAPRIAASRAAAIGISLILTAGVVAEIIAIRGSIDPEINSWEQRYLVMVLTVGTTGLALWLAAPIIAGASLGRYVRLGGPQVVVLLVISAIGGQIAVTQTLDRVDKQERLEKISDRRVETGRERRSAESTYVTARSRMIRMVNVLPDPLSLSLVRALGDVDQLVKIPSGGSKATVVERPARQIGRRDLRLARIGQEIAEVVADHAESWLSGHEPGFSQIRRELFYLGLSQFYSATSELIRTRVNSSLITTALFDVCKEIDGACERPPLSIREKSEKLQVELDELAEEARHP